MRTTINSSLSPSPSPDEFYHTLSRTVPSSSFTNTYTSSESSTPNGGTPTHSLFRAKEQAMRALIEEAEYSSYLNRWAETGREHEGDRLTTVIRIHLWMQKSKEEDNEILDLARLNLTTLPNLPEKVKYLDVSHNRLSYLPDPLPDHLVNLCATDNHLQYLPRKLNDKIEYINVSNNELQQLPELPSSLTDLEAAHNKLQSLPAFHTNLVRINVAHNYLTTLPELIHDVDINYEGNKILHSLATSVALWTKGDIQRSGHSTWKEFASEEGAEEFSLFLDALRTTVNFANDDFKHGVKEWLYQLAANANLRKKTFLISVGATETCQNRVSLTLNAMKKISMEVEVENGSYDNRTTALIHFARGMFRLNELEKFADKKFQLLKQDHSQIGTHPEDEGNDGPDEIELRLEYQIKLKKTLDLPLATDKKFYFGIVHTYLTEYDLRVAERIIKLKENEHFRDFLNTSWEPWHTVLKRFDTDSFKLCQDEIQRKVDQVSITLQNKISELHELNPFDYEEKAKVLIQEFDIEKNKITSELMDNLTRNLLKAHDVSESILGPIWVTDSPKVQRSLKRKCIN
jgi:hypothetical protein